MWQDLKWALRDWLSRVGSGTAEKLRAVTPRGWGLFAAIFVGLMLLYYPIGMIAMHTINDDPDYSTSRNLANKGGSAAVEAVESLIDREINKTGWVANDPFFVPSAMLDNMPNYQQGLMNALARFSFELRDQLGRTRGSSAVDADLESAAGLLPYPGDVWLFNPDVSLLPTASSEKQYLAAARALARYNARLAVGDAAFEKRSDNLLATLDRIALDIGASSAALETHIDENASGFFDFESDDLFYSVKGQAYGYFIILSALGEDFHDTLESRDLEPSFAQMLDSFRRIVTLDPMIVVNNEPDDLFFANHLTAQGFYLLRARTQLREITNILLK